MNVYKTEDVRNVVLLGHGGCGKTTLVEAMAYVSGAISRQGKVDDGSTLSDFDKEELQRRLVGENMYNTVIYWDAENEFASKNKIDKGIHFIGFVTDMYNNLLEVANPTILNFSEESLDRLQFSK